LTDLRCSALKSGASITVARRPRSFVRTRTNGAFTSARLFIMLLADFRVPSARRTRLTNVKPITVAKVCNRNELSAHWCEGAASLLIAAAACIGQTKVVPPHQREAPPPTKAAARPAVIPDATIEAAIRAKFAKSKINVEKFQVHLQGGVATIEGKANVIQHKGTATRLAKTGGAVAVNNHIQISDAAKQKAADNLEKGRRARPGDARRPAIQSGPAANQPLRRSSHRVRREVVAA
jgi:hypothetical protein